jgi:hypothetical protein
MISQPTDVLQDANWRGTSVDPATNNVNPNLDSSMDWAEHQRIVHGARGLLAGAIAINPPEVQEMFEYLRTAYNDNTSASTVTVSKGIHQPTVNAHIQIELMRKYYDADDKIKRAYQRYHLNVSAVDTPGKDDSFQWTGVQFTVKHGETYYGWPIVANHRLKSGALVRRNSISQVDLTKHEDDLKKQRQAADTALKLEAFNEVWSAFLAEQKLTKDTKYNKPPSDKFRNGTTTMHIASSMLRSHVKYDAESKAIVKCKPDGTKL